MKLVGLLAGACFGVAVHAATPAVPVDSGRISEIASWLPARAQTFGSPITNREAWDKLAGTRNGEAFIARAVELAKVPIPKVTDELYLDFSKTGNRTRCQEVVFARDARISVFALAECLENKGRFVGPMEEIIAEICAERSWVLPAHDGALKVFEGKAFDPDLRATLVAWDLATADYLLGERFSAETRQAIRKNVRLRVLAPFKAAVDGHSAPLHWIKARHNWNAVCLAGVTGAALALEDSAAERAFFIAATEKAILHFLAGFTPDGYCSEGMGYWNYGFGRFLMLAELVRQHTSGRIDLLSLPEARPPALFPFRAEIVPGAYPTIADCSPGAQPGREWVRMLRLRFGSETEEQRPEVLGGGDRSLAFVLMNSFLPMDLPRIAGERLPGELPARTWFGDGGVLICRPGKSPGRFSAVIKGGHNAEHHNHNDVGSFSVLLGNSVLICDPGSEEYTRRTFSSKRYESRVLNSYGHSVPVIGGKLQRPGRQAQAVVMGKDFQEQTDKIRFDLRSAYNVPELKKLERSFEYRRGKEPALVVEDTVSFSGRQSFETALITWSPWRQTGPAELQIGKGADTLKVRIDSGGASVVMSSEILDEDVHSRVKPMRIKLALGEPIESAFFRVTITPEEKR